ncbi:hypothetical protein LHEJCM20397_04820 [Lactobacillus helveticus]|nr:putative amino acid permease YbgF [Lactobacillus helveticus]GFP08619.1 hypothetical protein LHEJCM1006_07650 [Lactobacillus helveticus]GFP16934.1 hypothetical protein LHEJCM20397_04820 [Lactobacillus helveticus]GIP66288.1 hypothetical protein LhelvAHU1049_04930 [Lactobacillus helveticus]
MQKWFPQVSVWIWSLTCMILIFLSNFFSVKAFAESEFWFAAIKVFAIVAFIVLGGLAIAGFLPVKGYHAAPGLANFYRNGWFPNGFSGVFTTMLTINFAFSGTELIGVTAGEAENPQKAIPSAIKTTLWRCICISIKSKITADTVCLVLVSISGLAVVFVWMAIAWAELNFRKQFLKDGHQLSELKYKTPWYPVVPYFAFIASLLSCVLIWFDPTQRVALYYTIPFVLVCYLGHRFWLRRKDNEVVKEAE